MKKDNVKKLFTLPGFIFMFSFISALLINYPDYSASYDLGYSTGLQLKQGLKLSGVLGLLLFAIRMLRKRETQR